MIGDSYIDKQGYIYNVKKGQIKPHEIIWDEYRRRYNYYRFDKRGVRKMIPFRRVHASFLFWDPSSNSCTDHVQKYS